MHRLDSFPPNEASQKIFLPASSEQCMRDLHDVKHEKNRDEIQSSRFGAEERIGRQNGHGNWQNPRRTKNRDLR